MFFLLVSMQCLAQPKPNVVLILTDDQGWGDLSLHGNPWLKTPHLDGLAKSGAQLTNFYVSPLCAPTRASILTGRYHLSTGVVSVSKMLEVMDTEETTLAELFKANGYATGIFGKWHNGQHFPNRPNDQGFDEFLGFCAGHWSNYFNTNLNHNGQSIKTKGFITDVLTDAAIQFIDRNKAAPFFCYIPYNAPHSPHQVPDKYFNKYKAKGLNNELASIYGMVENVDDNVGRVLNYLKKNNLEENTIVIFLSDNGPNGVRFNGVMRGIKGSVHEGGVHVPFFINWKNHIAAGKIIETPMAHVDIFPTLSQLCSLNSIAGKPLAGKSFLNQVLNNSKAAKDDRNIFTHVNFMELPVTLNAGGFRNNRYRFVCEKDTAKLYDLVKDPGEKYDISVTQPSRTSNYLNDYSTWFTQATSSLKFERPIVLSNIGAELPTYDATLTNGIKFKEGHGWAHDWVSVWNTTTDSITWQIDCTEPGKYRVELAYLCKPANVGASIECRIGNNKQIFQISQPFYSKQIKSPDRVTRKEAYEMSGWKRQLIGTFDIGAGLQTIVLKALKVTKNVAEVNAIRLIRED